MLFYFCLCFPARHVSARAFKFQFKIGHLHLFLIFVLVLVLLLLIMKINPEVEANFPRLAENVTLWNHHLGVTWDSSISANLTITEARPNFLVFEFIVGDDHINGCVGLHYTVKLMSLTDTVLM